MYADDNMDMSNFNPYSHGNPKRIELDKVEDITLADYGWTPEALKEYMFGVEIKNPETGQTMGDAFYNHVYEVAIGKAEKELDIAILPRFIEAEHHDFYSSDFSSYMYTHAYKKPILQVERLQLEINGHQLYNYPANWWKVYSLAGHVELYPTALLQTGLSSAYNNVLGGYPTLAGLPPASNGTFSPQMIHLDYVAGMLPRKRAGISNDWEVPPDLEQLVIKYALRELFQVWGRLIIGAGIAGRTLSVDGISESIETTQSAMYTGSAADIEIIDRDIKELLASLHSYFGMNMGII
jgi:hypothetical protein